MTEQQARKVLYLQNGDMADVDRLKEVMENEQILLRHTLSVTEIESCQLVIKACETLIDLYSEKENGDVF